MNITINTDASFCPEQKVGGYAFWITSNLGRIKVKNTFKKRVASSSDAEILCILNAVKALKSIMDIDKHNIVINTDCEIAINALSKRFKNVRFKHVKSHVKDCLDKRTYANNWCDESAREMMRMARNGKNVFLNKKDLIWR